MNMLNALLDLKVPIGRAYYFANIIALVGFTAGLVTFIFKILGSMHGLFPLSIFLGINITIMAMGILIMLTIRRLRDMCWPGMLSLMLLIPGVNLVFFMYLSLVKGCHTLSN